MAAYFFDSSALVKRYTRETGTAWIVSLFRRVAGNRLYVMRLAEVEVVAAFTRRVRGKSLTAATADKATLRFERELANRYSIVEVSPTLLPKPKRWHRNTACAVMTQCS